MRMLPTSWPLSSRAAICLVLVSACALAATPPAAAAPQTTTRPPAPPPTTTRPPVPPPTTTTAPPAAPATARPAPVRQAAASPAPTAVQARGLVAVSGLVQPATSAFTDARELSYFRETASQSGRYDIDGGAGLDVAAFVRVWRRLGLGVGLSQVTRSGEAAFSGRYPHPFFFNQLRTADTIVPDLDRTDTGVHVSAAYLVTSPARVRVVLFAGPSFYRVSQDVVDDLTVNETYPYDTVAIAPGARSDLSKRFAGFHGGADVSWYFSRRVGVGALVRYAGGSTRVAIGSGESFDLDAGGVQAGLGLRVRF